jgi:hypothetical protein
MLEELIWENQVSNILFSTYIQTYASLLAKGWLTKELYVLKISFSKLSLEVISNIIFIKYFS